MLKGFVRNIVDRNRRLTSSAVAISLSTPVRPGGQCLSQDELVLALIDPDKLPIERRTHLDVCPDCRQSSTSIMA